MVAINDDDIKQLKQLASDLLMPELERQLQEDPSLIPNMKALFVLTIVKKRKPMATWYCLLQGKGVMPVITDNEDVIKNTMKRKVKVVKVEVEDKNMVNLLTGGMTGVKAYMTGRIKVRGDLLLAQQLEQVFEKANGRKRALTFLRENEQLRAALAARNIKAKL
ncbi:hypothetical protein RO3G_13053 [Lichtheimia corymbifera JMRC:FSU:9682]|uniref:SCP2 domain-containing protein n=1 Tax=Lichtheimia corymbifera JMRC:FSU:9682 TaxID=1263082 RepID=A0A068RXG5_9FUNG|nr:hypothetical protein RO3G_13053 [Lichtheimia corymbifera JMRC:FSU:9682]